MSFFAALYRFMELINLAIKEWYKAQKEKRISKDKELNKGAMNEAFKDEHLNKPSSVFDDNWMRRKPEEKAGSIPEGSEQANSSEGSGDK